MLIVACFPVGKRSRVILVIFGVVLAGYGTTGLFSPPGEAKQKASEFFRSLKLVLREVVAASESTLAASPTPSPEPSVIATPKVAPSPRTNPSPVPSAVATPTPSPRPIATEAPHEPYYPSEGELDQSDDDTQEQPEEWWPYYVDITNQTGVSLEIEYLYRGEWIQFSISPNVISTISADDKLLQVRLCECQDYDAAKPVWRLTTLQTDKQTGLPFELFINWKGKVDLRGGRPR